jgi:hypothetical protein
MAITANPTALAEDFALIKELDPEASIKLDTYGQFYVSAAIELAGNGMLSGASVHAYSPDAAIKGMLDTLHDPSLAEAGCNHLYVSTVVRGEYSGKRVQYRDGDWVILSEAEANALTRA